MAQTTVIDSFVHDGIYRNYRVYIPAIYDGSEPVPLLFNLHGYTSNAIEQEFYGDFRPIADTANFIVVHPNGTGPAGGQFWNGYTLSAPNDVGFIEALIDSLSVQYNINANRVYSCGMSNGGIMSYFLADHLNHKITAIGSVTGSMTHAVLASSTPADNIPAIEIHGTADGVVPYNGDATFAPIDSIVDFWADFNGCNPVPLVIPYPNTATGDGCTATEYAYSGGVDGSEVVLVKITGGGHTWPGAPVTIGVTNQDFDASIRLWQFFMKFDKGQFIGVPEQMGKTQFTHIYPNPANAYINIEGLMQGNHVMLVNSLGKTVLNLVANALPMKIDLAAYNPGIYILVAGNEKHVLVISK